MKIAPGLALILVLTLTGCATTSSSSSSNTNAQTDTSLEYFDATAFDEQLSRALKQRNESVEVNFVGEVPTNSLPPRLIVWLDEVSTRGGDVSVGVDPKLIEGSDRSLLPMLAKFLLPGAMGAIRKAYEHHQREKVYGPTDHYDANIYRKPDSDHATRVVFTRRDGA